MWADSGDGASESLIRRAKGIPVTTTATPGIQLGPGRQPRPAPGGWRVDPARSHASFAARVGGRPVRGRLPLTGEVLITEPVERSAAHLVARASAVSTGSQVLDRLLTGPGFLDAGVFPEISFRSDLLVWVPAGWRAVGHLQVKDAQHELACQLELDLADPGPDGSSHLTIASTWVMDSCWVTSQWIPALGRRIVMTCSFSLGPDV